MNRYIIVTYRTVKGLVREFGPEALRSCLAAMLPAFLIGYFYRIEFAVPFMIGALNASMTDFPGLQRDKLRVAIWGTCGAVFTALVTGFLLPYPVVLIAVIALLAGVYTLFAALGPRIGMVGVTNLLMITFTMGLKPYDPLQFALFVGLGTVFYHLVNIVHAWLVPLWELRRVIDTSYRTTAYLLRIKARCYEADTPLDKIYQRAAGISIRVAEQHETIRYLLLRNRRLLQRKNNDQYVIWLQAYLLMDLYSLVMAVDRDYNDIRTQLQRIGALEKVRQLIECIADGIELAADPHWQTSLSYPHFEQQVSVQISELERIYTINNNDDAAVVILREILANTDGFLNSIQHLHNRDGDDLVRGFFNQTVDYGEFLSPVTLSLKDIWTHVQSYSPLFYFALRMSLLFLVGGIAGYLFSGMMYTYWIFITIIVVARPSFSVTFARNMQRLTGTFLGVLLGLACIQMFNNVYLNLLLAGFLLFCFLLFNRRYYLVSVLFITASVVVALHLTDDTWRSISGSRLLFTLLGCALSVISWYIIPVRQEQHIHPLAKKVLHENDLFLEAILRYLQSPQDKYRFQVRLVRKRAFMLLTKFSDTCLQAQKEPGSSRERKQSVLDLHMELYRYHAMISNLLLQASQQQFQIPYSPELNEERYLRVVEFRALLNKI